MTPSCYASGEKFTATISTFIVLGIVAGVLTAQPASRTVSEQLAQLKSDLSFQLDLAYRLDLREREKRQSEFDRALAAWQASPQSDADATLFAEWLHEAIDRSLPGRRESLPAPPSFGKRGQAAAPAVGNAPDLTVAREPAGAETVAPRVATNQPPAASHAQPSRHATAPQSPAPGALTPPPIAHERQSSARRPAERLAAKPIIDPRPSAPDQSASAPAPPPKLALASQPTLEPPAPTPVAVNLAELNARITGYHEGLAEVMATAVAERGRLSLQRLTDLIDETEELAREHEFVALYFGALSEDERSAVVAPRPFGPAVKLVRSELEAASNSGDDDFLRPFEADDRDVSDLDSRLEKLADAAGE